MSPSLLAAIVGQLQPEGSMGVALEWKPWNWDLWNTPQEPGDDDDSLEVYRQMLREALEAGREDEKTLAEKLPKPNP